MNTIIEEEILDIVDENNTIVRQQKRSEYYANKIDYLRSVAAFVRNSAGQLWIPRRVASKKLFPLYLDASVSGHVSAGESYYEAFARETVEETGINVSTVTFRELGILGLQEGLTAFCSTYIIDYERIDNYNQEDFCESYWLYPDEIFERIKNGDRLKSDPQKILELLQDVL